MSLNKTFTSEEHHCHLMTDKKFLTKMRISTIICANKNNFLKFKEYVLKYGVLHKHCFKMFLQHNNNEAIQILKIV